MFQVRENLFWCSFDKSDIKLVCVTRFQEDSKLLGKALELLQKVLDPLLTVDDFLGENKVTFVIKQQGVVIGCLLGNVCYDGEFFIDYLAVDSNYRGVGSGKRLVDAAKRKASEMGLVKIKLLALSTSITFYEKQGFIKDFFGSLCFMEFSV